MQVYLPIAEMTVPSGQILSLGLAVGFLSGLFGIGGGVLITPFLIFMGLPPAVAVGTQATQIIAASVSGVLGHWKRGNVDARLAFVMLGGSSIGSLAGILIFRLLQRIGQIDIAIPILYVLLLGLMGGAMLIESVFALLRRGQGGAEERPLHLHAAFQNLPARMRFPRSKLYVSALLPAGIGFAGGLLVSIMGIGGGFLLVPAMIYILGMPTLLVVGTSMFQIMLTTVVTTMLHALSDQTIDLVLAALLIAGGVVGTQLGLRFSRRMKGVYARAGLALLLLSVSAALGWQLFAPPDDLYSLAVR
jgi:uncharacterized membrane protein YfcA